MNDSDAMAPGEVSDLDVWLGEAERLLAEGDRPGALEQARLAVAGYPGDARSHRMLSDVLTHKDLYRHESELCRQLVEDGSIAEALARSRTAMRLPNRSFEDYLQAGYCLTALGKFDEATEMIRAATDLFSQELQPGLFTAISDKWQALAPKFLIIGVKKGGTTSLHRYLSRHPLVLPPVVKEMDYFAYPERGLDWYLAHFPRRPDWEKRFISGEGHVGKFSRRDVLPLVREQLPGVKLIAVLRDPAKRALSDYYHDKRAGMEHRSLEQAMDEELAFLDCPDDRLAANLKEYWKTQRGYVVLGLYSRHLEAWLGVFPPKDLLVVISEELKSDPEKEMRRVYKHLGLKFHPLADYGTEHPGQYDDQPKERVLAKLDAFFAKHNERLYELLGRRLKWPRGGGWSYDGPLALQASQARIAMLKGKWADASRLWKDCIASFPDHPDRVAWLAAAGEALRRTGKLEDAAAAFADLRDSAPQSALALSALADLAQARRDWTAARAHWEECLSRFPGHAESERWLIAYLRVLRELGDWDAAEVAYGQMARERPGSPEGHVGLAQCAARKKQHARAAQLWEACLSRFPQHADRPLWQRELARSLLEDGKLAEAAEALDAMPEGSADVAGLLAQLAQRARQAGDLALAERLIGDCLARFPAHGDRQWWLALQGELLLDQQSFERARDIYAKLRAEYPDVPGGYSGLARAAQRLGDTAVAAEAMGACIAKFPGHAERRWWLPFQANALCSLNEWDKAEPVFDAAVREHGEELAGHWGLARVALHRKDWPAAARLLQACIDKFPDHAERESWREAAADAQQRVARSLLDEGKLAEAAKALEALPEGSADIAGPLAQLAQRARQAGDLVLAERLISDCLQRFPSHGDRQWWLALQGELLLDLHSTERARDIFAQLRAEFPDSPAGYSGLARATQRLGDTAASAEAMGACIARFPGHAERRWWLPFHANALGSLNRWDEADAVFATAVSEHGEEPAGHSGLARVALHRKDWPAAARLLQACIGKFPDHPERESWREAAADAQQRMARALLEDGKFDEAAKALDALPEGSADIAGLLAQLAQRARQAGDLALAERLLGDCLARFPSHGDRQWWLALQGEVLLDLQSTELARNVYTLLRAEYPDNPSGYGGLARAAQRLGDTAASAEAMGACIARFPGHPERRWWLPFHANALCSLNRWDEAEAVFEAAVREHGEEPAGHSGLARVAVHRKDWPAAVRLLRDCIDKFPEHPERGSWREAAADAQQRMARALLDDGKLAEAAEVVDALPEGTADVAGLMSQLAQRARQAGDLALAERLIGDCLARFPSHPDRQWWLALQGELLLDLQSTECARGIYAQLRAEFPDSPVGYSGLARAAQRLGDTAASAEAMGACIAKFPGHAERRWWLPFHANALCSLNRWDEAEPVFEAAVREHGEEPAGHSGLARVAVHRKDWPLAARLLQACIDKFPDHAERASWIEAAADARQRVARSLLEDGKLAEAAKAVAALPEGSADVAALLSQLAQRARQAGDLALAERLIGDCLARFPSHPDRQWWLALQGELLLDQQSTERARDVYAQLRAEYPDNPSGYSGLARATQRLGDTAASAEAMGACIARFPGHAERRWWLPFHANTLCSLNEWDEAEAVFEAAVREHGEEPAGHSGLARVAVHRQDWPVAVRLLRDCIAKFPDYHDMGWWGEQLRDCEQRLSQTS